MADRNRRMGLIIVTAVVAVGAAALAFVFLWWMPRQDRAEARGQVTTWERRWSSARGCLLGEPALSADPGEALALRELSAGLVRSDTSCTDGVRELMRPQGAASPLESVEHAWAAVEAAIPALGEAYVMWISSEPDERDAWLTKLGVAISSLDAAQDELRRAAGMSALVRQGSVTLTRLDAPTPVIAGGLPVTTAGARIRAGTITTQVFVDRSATDVIITGPDQARVLPAHDALAVLAVPDGSWSVVASPADGSIVAGAAIVVPAGGLWVPIAALGTGAERSVVLESMAEEELRLAHPLALARSSDGGATWLLDDNLAQGAASLRTLDLDYVHAVVDLALDVDDGTRLIHLDAARPLAPLVDPQVRDRFPSFEQTCRKGATLWWKDDDAVAWLRDGQFHTTGPVTGDRVIDCTDQAALVESGGMPVIYSRCDDQTCKDALRGGAYTFGRAAMLDDGRVVYAAARGRVIAAWTEDTVEPRFFKLPAPLLLHAVIVWAGVPYALLYAPDDAKQALLRVPLR